MSKSANQALSKNKNLATNNGVVSFQRFQLLDILPLDIFIVQLVQKLRRRKRVTQEERVRNGVRTTNIEHHVSKSKFLLQGNPSSSTKWRLSPRKSRKKFFLWKSSSPSTRIQTLKVSLSVVWMILNLLLEKRTNCFSFQRSISETLGASGSFVIICCSIKCLKVIFNKY